MTSFPYLPSPNIQQGNEPLSKGVQAKEEKWVERYSSLLGNAQLHNTVQ